MLLIPDSSKSPTVSCFYPLLSLCLCRHKHTVWFIAWGCITWWAYKVLMSNQRHSLCRLCNVRYYASFEYDVNKRGATNREFWFPPTKHVLGWWMSVFNDIWDWFAFQSIKKISTHVSQVVHYASRATFISVEYIRFWKDCSGYTCISLFHRLMTWHMFWSMENLKNLKITSGTYTLYGLCTSASQAEFHHVKRVFTMTCPLFFAYTEVHKYLKSIWSEFHIKNTVDDLSDF